MRLCQVPSIPLDLFKLMFVASSCGSGLTQEEHKMIDLILAREAGKGPSVTPREIRVLTADEKSFGRGAVYICH